MKKRYKKKGNYVFTYTCFAFENRHFASLRGHVVYYTCVRRLDRLIDSGFIRKHQVERIVPVLQNI